MATVRAKSTFWYSESGLLREGDLYDSEDPLVRANPDWFDAELRVVSSTGVEQATAAPGEKRAAKRA